jgi:hypothetical protein
MHQPRSTRGARVHKVAVIAVGALLALTFATAAHATNGVTAGFAGPASGPGPIAVTASNTDTIARTDTVVVHWSRGITVTSTDVRCVLGSYSHKSGKLTVVDPELRCPLNLAAGATASLASATAASPNTSLSITAVTAVGTAFYYFNPGTPAVVVPGNVLVYGDLAVGHQATAKLYVSNTGTLPSLPGSATLTLGSNSYAVVVPGLSGGATQQYIADVTLSPSAPGNQALSFTTSGGSSTRTVTVLSGLANLVVFTSQPDTVVPGGVFDRSVAVANVGDGPTTGYVLVSEPLNELTFVASGPECHEQDTFSGPANNRTVRRSVECVIYAPIATADGYVLTYSLQAPSTLGPATSTVSITGLVGPGAVSVPSSTSTVTVAVV